MNVDVKLIKQADIYQGDVYTKAIVMLSLTKNSIFASVFCQLIMELVGTMMFFRSANQEIWQNKNEWCAVDSKCIEASAWMVRSYYDMAPFPQKFSQKTSS